MSLQSEGVPDLPTARADICVVLVTAPDKSSYNIFMIAGVCKSNHLMFVLTMLTVDSDLQRTHHERRNVSKDTGAFP